MSSWISAGILERGESLDSVTISVPLPWTTAFDVRNHFGRVGCCRFVASSGLEEAFLKEFFMFEMEGLIIFKVQRRIEV
jgi:hypothetical protein